jgi:hypothetical protein
MKKILPILILFVSCSKSNDNKPAPPQAPIQKYVLLRVEYSGGSTAIIDGVYLPDSITHSNIMVAGPYSASATDSIKSPSGLTPQVYLHGGNGTDHVTLIDQNNKKQDAAINPNNPNIVSLPNCYAVDSFVIKVYR